MTVNALTEQATRRLETFHQQVDLVRTEVGRVIVGNDAIVSSLITCLFTDGHVLLEGIPGLGKTLLVQTLADVLRLNFSRIQFTPDLMPGDVIGTHILHEDENGDRTLVHGWGPPGRGWSPRIVRRLNRFYLAVPDRERISLVSRL